MITEVPAPCFCERQLIFVTIEHAKNLAKFCLWCYYLNPSVSNFSPVKIIEQYWAKENQPQECDWFNQKLTEKGNGSVSMNSLLLSTTDAWLLYRCA